MSKTSDDRSLAQRIMIGAVAVMFGYLAHMAVIFLGAKLAGVDFWDTRSYVRWDSGYYLTLSIGGYYAEACPPPNSADICGNGAWMPLYSWMIRLNAMLMDVDVRNIGFVISQLFCIGMMALVWFSSTDGRLKFRNFALLLAIAWFPGNIYFTAVFPLALLGFALLWGYSADRKGSSISAAAACFMAPLSYSTGWLLSGSLAAAKHIMGFLSDRRIDQIFKRLLKPHAEQLYLLAALSAIALAFWVAYLQTGISDLYFKVQASYHYDTVPPFDAYRKTIKLLSELSLVQARAWQLLAVLAFVLTISWKMWKQQIPLNKNYLAILIAAWLGILIPASLGAYWAFFRSDCVLLGTVLLLPYFSTRALIFWLGVFCVISAVMASLFFTGTLV